MRLFFLIATLTLFVLPGKSQEISIDSLRKKQEILEQRIKTLESGNTRQLLKNQEEGQPQFMDTFKNCQDCKDPNLLLYDFKCKHFYYYKDGGFHWLKDLKNYNAYFDREFKVKVVNINRYVYDVDFSADDIEFGSEQPALFKQLFVGEGSFVSDLITKLGQLTPQMMDGDSSLETNFEDAIRAFLNGYYKLLDRQLSAYQYCPEEFYCCGDTRRETKIFSDYANKLLKLKIAYQDYNQKIGKEIVDTQKDIDEAQKDVDKCKEKKEDLESKFKAEMNEAKKKAIQDKMDALECDGKMASLNEAKARKSFLESVKSDMEKLWASVEKIDDEELMKLILFNNNLVADHFSYTSPPIYPHGNNLSLGLRIKASDSSLVQKWNSMPIYDDSLGFDLLVRGKWFVSFSAGPFFGSKHLRNNSFSWQPQLDVNGVISDSSQYLLVETGQGSSPVGIGAFANLGTKFYKNIGFGIAVGAGIAVEKNPRPAYFIGGSFLFGEKQQLNLTIGAAFMQINRINEEVYPNAATTLYSKRPSSIEFNKQLRGSVFASLSYTFYSFQRTQNTFSGSGR